MSQFVRRCFERLPHWSQSRVDFSTFFSLARQGALLARGAIPQDDLRVFDTQQRRVGAAEAWSFERIDEELRRRKASIACSRLHVHDRGCNRLALEFEHSFGLKTRVNSYLTPPQTQTLGLHWDDHDVFVLQLEGTKEWRLYPPERELPLEGEHGFEKHGRPSHRFVLRPSSVLYLPRGYPHEARAVGGASFHLTVALHPIRGFDLVEEMTREALRRCRADLAFRYGLYASDFDGSRAGKRIAADLARRFGREVSRIAPDELWRRIDVERAGVDLEAEEHRWSNRPLDAELGPEDWIARTRRRCRFGPSRYGDFDELQVGSFKLVTPRSHRRSVRRILRATTPVRVQELAALGLRTDELLELLDELYQAGLVTPRTEARDRS